MTTNNTKALEALKEPFRKKYWEAFFNGARHDEMLDQAWPWLVEQVVALSPPQISGLREDDLKALAEFKSKYPTWWYKLGWCDLTRDFDCAPQGHSPEAHLIKPGNIWDSGFSCDHKGTFEDAIRDVMAQIDVAALQEGTQAPIEGEFLKVGDRVTFGKEMGLQEGIVVKDPDGTLRICPAALTGEKDKTDSIGEKECPKT